jgi:iron(III) transport system permease protein
VARTCFGIAAFWIAFTIVCYVVIFVGGFVKDIGRGDMTLSLAHFAAGFGVDWGPRGLLFTGSAWNSFFTTIEVAAVSAAADRDAGSARRLRDHAASLRGATIVRVPDDGELRHPGDGHRRVVHRRVQRAAARAHRRHGDPRACFVFRNMPVGVRAGVAALAQIDKTLDEASSTLRASTVRTLRQVIVPLLRPAILATLVFSFTHAMTAVSAVIFLATAKYNLSTVYIINRVEAGEYPLAIAYSSVLIVFMLAVLLVVQKGIGEARLGRRATTMLATGH